jgi:hypothetical protein
MVYWAIHMITNNLMLLTKRHFKAWVLKITVEIQWFFAQHEFDQFDKF